MVPIIVFVLFKKYSLEYMAFSNFCVSGVYLLTNFHDATVRLGDGLSNIGCSILESSYNFYR